MSLDTSVPDVLFARSDFIASNAFGDAMPSLVPPLVRGRIGQILAFCNVHPPIMPLLVGMIEKNAVVGWPQWFPSLSPRA